MHGISSYLGYSYCLLILGFLQQTLKAPIIYPQIGKFTPPIPNLVCCCGLAAQRLLLSCLVLPCSCCYRSPAEPRCISRLALDVGQDASQRNNTSCLSRPWAGWPLHVRAFWKHTNRGRRGEGVTHRKAGDLAL
jgi:hypothetical protein